MSKSEAQRYRQTFVTVSAEELIRQISEDQVLYFKVVMDTGKSLRTVESLRVDEVDV